jgi:TRAP-type C4-dicarboxylate transport system substrate-binding protein
MNQKMKKAFTFLLVAFMILFAFASCSSNNDQGGDEEASGETSESTVTPVTWKFATNIYEDTDFARALVEMFDRWNEETNGEVTVEPYYQSALGAEADVIQNLQTGNIEVAYFSLALLSQFNPAWNVMDLPFIFDSTDHFKRYAATDEAQALFAKFRENGLWFNYCAIQGFRITNLVNKNLYSADDYKGLTIRTMDNAVQMATIEALGGIPITMPYNDVYNALKMNVADGWTGVYTGMNEISSYEAAPYVCDVPMFGAVISIVLSEKALDSISPGAAETIKSIYSEMMPGILDVAASEDILIRDDLINSGKIKDYNKIEDTAPFIEKVQPVWNNIAQQYEGVQEQIDLINSVR